MVIARDGDVVLRELTGSDLPKLADYANNQKVSMNLRDAFPSPYTLEDARKFLDMVNNQHPKTYFAIEFQGEYVGNISLSTGSDINRKSAEIGYFIGEPFWNQGIATRAVNLITRFGFGKLDIVRIHTGVFQYNRASQRVLEKCGFEKEAVFKKALTQKGKVYDEIRYATWKDTE